MQLVNSVFLLFLCLKWKTFEYESCSKFWDLQLLFQALFHLNNGLKDKIWNFSAFENVLFKAELKVFFKFRAETWNLAKMKVGEEEKFHNIDVGQKLIRVLDLGENKGQG